MHFGSSGRTPFVVVLVCAIYSCLVHGLQVCSEGCTQYGTCYEELGRCDCPWNYTGPACQQHFPEGSCYRSNDANTCVDGDLSMCVNRCNERGRCRGGFCHCDAGYFGTDCSLSSGQGGTDIKILDGLGYKQNKRGPLIYVYELPPEFHVKRNMHDVDRPPLHIALLERILTNGHRTTDGEEADYYYVPISSRDLKKAFLLMPVLQYIMQAWPYWNATGGGGARHIIPMEGDVGTCELPIAVRKITSNTTWLQFWGLYDFHPSWSHVFHNRIPCFVPGRDIVVPFMAMSSHDRFLIQTPLRPGNPQLPKNTTFFFAGGICGSGRYSVLPPNCTHYKQQRYSGGVRQAIYENYHNRSGWRVVAKTDDYARDYMSSNFCLAAPGGGWGKRGIVASMYGCIPVIATDMLYEAFEPEMSWDHFGVRIAQKDIPQLAQILESLPDEKIAEMQKRTQCAAQHFHWSSNIGGLMLETGEFDAFSSIMMILRMRKRYPNRKPQEFYDLDQEFRDFVNCQPDKEQQHKPLCSMYVGPKMILHRDTCPPQNLKYWFRRKIGPPGGAVCTGSLNMASCPRF